MDYVEILIYSPIGGVALLYIGSKIYGIELRTEENRAEYPEAPGFVAAIEWDIKRGGFAYSAYFKKPHLRILRLSILVFILPTLPLAFYFIGEISFRAMCMGLFWWAFVMGNAYFTEIGDDSVMAGLGFSLVTRVIILIGFCVGSIGGIVGGFWFLQMIWEFGEFGDLLGDLFAG